MSQAYNQKESSLYSKTTYPVSQQEELQSLKEWFRFSKMHKCVSAQKIDGLNGPSDQTKSYKFLLHNIKNFLPKQSAKESKLGIRLYANLFSIKLKKFFGRTMESQLCMLDPTDSGNWVLATPDDFSIYYHTRVDSNSDCVITIEIYLYEMQEYDVVKSTESLGYISVPLLKVQDSEGGEEQVVHFNTALLKKGSPRELISMTAEQAKKEKGGSIGLEYMVTHSQYFDRVKYLVPESCLVGSNEVVPGLLKPFILPANDQQKGPQCDDQGFIVVHGIQVSIPEKILSILNSNIRGQANSNQPVPTFKERRLRCAIHNGWTLVNTGGLENGTILKQGVVKEVEDGKKMHIFDSDLKVQIDKIFCHQYGLLIFQLEDIYSISKQGQVYYETRVLGYIPKPIKAIIDQPNYQIRMEDLIQGKGKTVDGKRLLEFGNQKDSIKINLNIDATVNADMGGNNGSYNKGNQQRQQQMDKEYEQQKRDWEKEKEREQEKWRQEKQRREEDFAKSQYNNQGSPQTYRGDSVDDGQGLRNNQQQPNMRNTSASPEQIRNMNKEQVNMISDRLNDYENKLRGQVLDMKEQQRDQMENTQKGFQDIKKMIFEMQKTQEKERDQMRNTQQSRRDDSRGRNNYNKPRFEDEDDEYYGGKYYTSEQDKDRERMYQTITNVERKPRQEQDRAYVSDTYYNQRDLKQGDITFLQSQGVRGLLDNTVTDGKDWENEDNVLRKEMEDTLKANEIKVKFLAIKPRIEEILENNKKDSIFNENFCIPERLRFSMNFYDFPRHESDTISYENAGNQQVLNKQLQQHQQIVLMRETFLQRTGDVREAAYCYSVDPSDYQHRSAHRDFIKYLYKKSMHIDIWDADTLMLYGTCKIPLQVLLRKGSPDSQSCKEYDIIDPNFTRIKGSVIIQLINTGKQCKIQDGQNFHSNDINKDAKNINTYQNASKKKVKSSQPVQVPTQFRQLIKDSGKSREEIIKDPEERRRQRIAKFKHTQLQEALSSGNQAGQGTLDIKKQGEAKKKLLEEIDQYKQSKKDRYVKSVLSQFLSDEKIHPCFFGKVDIIPYQFTNKNKNTMSYHVQIQDPDERFLEQAQLEPELSLIDKRSEWEHWIKRRGESSQNDFDKIKQGYLTLAAGESITLLFKFLTYRKLDPQMQNTENLQELVEEKDDAYRQTFINTRSISVFISETEKQATSQGFKLRVEPHMQVIDHFFRYYERENRQLNINLPSLYHASEAPRQKALLHVTKKEAKVEWVGNTEVNLQVRAPQAAHISRFNILAYTDPYKSELLGNWQIEIHSLKGIELSKVKMGQTVPFKLTVDSDIQRTVKLYSSHPFIVGFREKDQEPKSLQPNRTEIIEAQAKSYSQDSKKVQVNCVDINSKELVHSWIVSIDTDAPTVSKVYNIECNVGQDNFHRIQYYNRAPNYYIFSFESSDPEILEIIDSKMGIEKGTKEPIKVKFRARDAPGMAEAFVFAQDENERNFEVLLFKIKYKYTDSN